jgi:Holliday junction resolvasome RuvABC endonuclease subunit
MAKDKVFGPGVPDSAIDFAIGLDQSYSGFGVTIMDVDTEKYTTVVFKAEDLHVDRLLWISQKLASIISPVAAKASTVSVAMEGYAYGSQMSHMLGELGAVVKLVCYQQLRGMHGQYPYIIPPTTLKKYVTGKGNGIPKSAMMMHVFKKWGAEFNNDNAADSYALARIAAGKATLAYEQEIQKNITDPKYREKP